MNPYQRRYVSNLGISFLMCSCLFLSILFSPASIKLHSIIEYYFFKAWKIFQCQLTCVNMQWVTCHGAGQAALDLHLRLYGTDTPGGRAAEGGNSFCFRTDSITGCIAIQSWPKLESNINVWYCCKRGNTPPAPILYNFRLRWELVFCPEQGECIRL